MGMVDGMGMGRGIRVRVGMGFGVKGRRGYGMSLPLRPHENQLRPLGSQRGDVASFLSCPVCREVQHVEARLWPWVLLTYFFLVLPGARLPLQSEILCLAVVASQVRKASNGRPRGAMNKS